MAPKLKMPNLFPSPEASILTRAAVLAAAFLLGACGGPVALGDNPSGPDGPLFYNGMASLSKVNADPQQLLGMDSAALNDLLGEPVVVRREGEAEIWQYRSDECVLDLFLYGGMRQVEHVDLRDRAGASEEVVAACFVDIMESGDASS